jgi:hypothetical protein
VAGFDVRFTRWWPFGTPPGNPAHAPAPSVLLAVVGDERQLTLEHEHELVLPEVPVAERRRRAGRQRRQVDAERREPERVAEHPFLAARSHGLHRVGRIARAGARLDGHGVEGGARERSRHATGVVSAIGSCNGGRMPGVAPVERGGL